MATTEWDELAEKKLMRVLGDSEGASVFQNALRKLGVQRLLSANDVYRLAQVLKEGTPVIAAVGAMLALTAVMKGANPEQLVRPSE
jgi:hypothetical protein